MPQLSRVVETEHHILPSTLGTDDEAWVDLKKKIRHGDVSEARKVVFKVSEADVAMMMGPGGADPRLMAGQVAKGVDPASYPDALLAQVIVAWNYTDEDGQPLKIALETVALLEEQDADYLWNIVQEKTRGRHPLGNGSSAMPSSPSSPVVAAAPTTRKQHRR